MKIKTLESLLLTSLFLLLNCNDNDDINETNGIQEKKLESYKFTYMHYPQAGMLINSSNNVTIQYDSNNRPVKRIGGLLATAPASGFNYIFSPDVYNEIAYNNNNATVISKLNSSQGNTISEDKKIFEFENGKIVKKTIVNTNETVQYVYEQNRILKMISQKNNLLSSQSNIYYNQNGNVDSIVTRMATWNDTHTALVINFNSKVRTVELFKNYDNKSNPTKKLMIFDEIFPRTLSQNNYSSYENKSYNIDGQVYQFYTRNWTLNYINNEINFVD